MTKTLLKLKIEDTFFNLMKGNFQQKQIVASYLMVKRETDKTALVMKEDLKKTRKLFFLIPAYELIQLTSIAGKVK